MHERWRTLTRPELIDRLFLDAAAEGYEGTARIGDGSHVGRFSWPGGPALVVFRTAKPARIQANDSLSVEVRASEACFRFHARVRSARGCELQLDRPRMVDLLDRRREPRIPVAEGLGYRWRSEQEGLAGDVLDLSRSGLAVRLPNGQAARVGLGISGWVERPGSQPMAVRARVANHRDTDEGVIIGLEIVEMTAHGRHRLDKAVEALMERGREADGAAEGEA